MLRLRRALTTLLLSAPLHAQVARLAAPAPLLAAPAPAAVPAVFLSAAAAPALLVPSAVLSLSASAPLLAAPAPAPFAAASAAPGKAKPRAARASAAPDSFGRVLFDGSLELKTRSGSVFVPSRRERPEVPGGFAFIRARPAPAAPVGPVPGTEGLHGHKLLARVRQIAQNDQRPHSYRAASRFLFSTADNHTLGGVRGVADAYSGVFVPGTSGEGQDYSGSDDPDRDDASPRETMNVEHVFPQTYFRRESPMRSDLHILMATFAGPNEIRGNLPFGVVKGRPDYRNEAGAKRGGGVFEPPDFTKGRVARAMLYFYARYHLAPFFDLRAAEFWNSQVETLLDWNRRFPPTVEDRRRNDLDESFQGNRNPFIDDPTLADRIGLNRLRDFRAQDRPDRRSDRPRKGKRREPAFQRRSRGSRR